MNSDNLKAVLQQFISRPLPRCQARELSLPIGSKKVVGLAGVRRSGKTFLFFHTIQKLADKGIDRSRLIYLNFEDDRLQPLRSEDLDLILRTHRELFPKTIGQRCYLFLDEVQNVTGWERWVRRIYDTEDVELFVTGSSSQLLTRGPSSQFPDNYCLNTSQHPDIPTSQRPNVPNVPTSTPQYASTGANHFSI